MRLSRITLAGLLVCAYVAHREIWWMTRDEPRLAPREW